MLVSTCSQCGRPRLFVRASPDAATSTRCIPCIDPRVLIPWRERQRRGSPAIAEAVVIDEPASDVEPLLRTRAVQRRTIEIDLDAFDEFDSDPRVDEFEFGDSDESDERDETDEGAATDAIEGTG